MNDTNRRASDADTFMVKVRNAKEVLYVMGMILPVICGIAIMWADSNYASTDSVDALLAKVTRIENKVDTDSQLVQKDIEQIQKDVGKIEESIDKIAEIILQERPR